VTQADAREIQLPPATLRRLARLHSRIEGVQLAQNALTLTMQQMQAALREVLTEACEEEGMTIPGNGSASVDIDWRTGTLRLGAQAATPMPEGNGVPGPAF
jgi:hypothetical protein